MFKNRYVFWGVIVTWVLILAGAGGWFVFVRDGSAKDLQHAGAQAGISANEDAAVGNTNAQTISGATTNTGVTISGGATGSSRDVNANGAASDAAKLLDPTTFGQYDKYKDTQTAVYIDLQKGTGDTVSAGKTAVVVYRGWLTNGTLFDESKIGSDGKLQAFSFVLGQHQVIAGWEQAVDGMKVGGVRLLIVPPAVGYGPTGQGPIPGNSVLVFQVQLVQVQ
jgi:FKBP-type peptidyl-prolyl cis-trans isomerase FkpA